MKFLIAFLFAITLSACSTIPGRERVFSFALIGDQQYDQREELLFPQLLGAINETDVKFVVHVGDFKAGSNVPCTDELYAARHAELNTSRHPLIYLPGDNDWVDCRRPTNGPYVPLERLDKLRALFFAKPESLGQNPIALMQQSRAFAGDPVLSRYAENTMWIHGGIVFVTVNVQGSNDNRGFDAANDAEQIERTVANLKWLDTAIEKAHTLHARGIAIFLQANPGFEDKTVLGAKSGFKTFIEGFDQRARAYGKPILFAHGDTHQFRVDQPYVSPASRTPIANVTRVETWGSPNVDWVRISVQDDGVLFHIESGRFSAR